MTDAQEDAIKKAREILNEHFEAWALCLQCEAVEDKTDHFPVAWHGGAATAIGLFRLGQLDAEQEKDREEE